MSKTAPQNVPQPSEAEAWKLMMDSMVKFISASTRLMQTINERAQRNSTTTASLPLELPECEIECMICPDKKDRGCGVCAASRVGQNGGKKIERGEPVAPAKQKKIEEIIDDAENKEVAEGEEEPKITEGEEEPVIAESEEEPKIAEGEEEPKIAEGEEEPKIAEGEEEPKIAEGEEEPKIAEGEEEPKIAEATERRKSSISQKGDNATERRKSSISQKGDNATERRKSSISKKGDVCVCREVREIKEKASQVGVTVDDKKGACTCARKSVQPEPEPKIGACTCAGKSAEPEPEPEPEPKTQLCACEVGPKEKQKMTKELAEKLNKTQQEIQSLQREMARLQELDSKKPNAATLYREIMKDCSSPALQGPRRTSFQTPYSQPQPQPQQQLQPQRQLQQPPQAYAPYSYPPPRPPGPSMPQRMAPPPRSTPIQPQPREDAFNRAYLEDQFNPADLQDYNDGGWYDSGQAGYSQPSAEDDCICPPDTSVMVSDSSGWMMNDRGGTTYDTQGQYSPYSGYSPDLQAYQSQDPSSGGWIDPTQMYQYGDVGDYEDAGPQEYLDSSYSSYIGPNTQIDYQPCIYKKSSSRSMKETPINYAQEYTPVTSTTDSTAYTTQSHTSQTIDPRDPRSSCAAFRSISTNITTKSQDIGNNPQSNAKESVTICRDSPTKGIRRKSAPKRTSTPIIPTSNTFNSYDTDMCDDSTCDNDECQTSNVTNYSSYPNLSSCDDYNCRYLV